MRGSRSPVSDKSQRKTGRKFRKVRRMWAPDAHRLIDCAARRSKNRAGVASRRHFFDALVESPCAVAKCQERACLGRVARVQNSMRAAQTLRTSHSNPLHRSLAHDGHELLIRGGVAHRRPNRPRQNLGVTRRSIHGSTSCTSIFRVDRSRLLASFGLLRERRLTRRHQARPERRRSNQDLDDQSASSNTGAALRRRNVGARPRVEQETFLAT